MKFLHVGCGHKTKQHTTIEFANWDEIRFDIDPSVDPDLIGTITDMSAVDSLSVDAIYSSHNIEHLYPHEVPLALAEFLRVLRSDGFAVITCPDLRSVCELVVQDKLTQPAYIAPTGEITPLDMLYGLREPIAKGSLYMAHRCGFTETVLRNTLLASGFRSVATMVRGVAPFFDLWALASKSLRYEEEMKRLVIQHFPVSQ
jgi:hypothetical protein